MWPSQRPIGIAISMASDQSRRSDSSRWVQASCQTRRGRRSARCRRRDSRWWKMKSIGVAEGAEDGEHGHHRPSPPAPRGVRRAGSRARSARSTAASRTISSRRRDDVAAEPPGSVVDLRARARRRRRRTRSRRCRRSTMRRSARRRGSSAARAAARRGKDLVLGQAHARGRRRSTSTRHLAQARWSRCGRSAPACRRSAPRTRWWCPRPVTVSRIRKTAIDGDREERAGHERESGRWSNRSGGRRGPARSRSRTRCTSGTSSADVLQQRRPVAC